MTELKSLLEDFGLSLAIMLFGAWSLIRVAKWIRPKADDWINARIESERVQQDTQQMIAKMLQVAEKTHRGNTETLGQVDDLVGQINDRTKDPDSITSNVHTLEELREIQRNWTMLAATGIQVLRVAEKLHPEYADSFESAIENLKKMERFG